MAEETVASFLESDRLFRQAATTFLRGLSASAAADRLHRELIQYRECAWRRERAEEVCPHAVEANLKNYFG